MNINVTVEVENEDGTPLTDAQIANAVKTAAAALGHPDMVATISKRTGSQRPRFPALAEKAGKAMKNRNAVRKASVCDPGRFPPSVPSGRVPGVPYVAREASAGTFGDYYFSNPEETVR